MTSYRFRIYDRFSGPDGTLALEAKDYSDAHKKALGWVDANKGKGKGHYVRLESTC